MNVNDVIVIVFGKYVIVGIDVGKDIDCLEVSLIKYIVVEGLKVDLYGVNFVVIVDFDMVVWLK